MNCLCSPFSELKKESNSCMVPIHDSEVEGSCSMTYNDEATIQKKSSSITAFIAAQRTWCTTPPGPAPPLTGKKPTIFVSKWLYQIRNISVIFNTFHLLTWLSIFSVLSVKRISFFWNMPWSSVFCYSFHCCNLPS